MVGLPTAAMATEALPPPPGAIRLAPGGWDAPLRRCGLSAAQALRPGFGPLDAVTYGVPAEAGVWDRLVAHYQHVAGPALPSVPARFNSCRLRAWSAGNGGGPVAVMLLDQVFGEAPGVQAFTVFAPQDR